MKLELPRPTQEELRLGYKVDYMTRILSSSIYKEQNIPIAKLADAASKMFNECFICNTIREEICE